MRLRFLLPFLLIPLLLPNPLRAADRGSALGFTLGEPTGASFKYWVDQDEAWIFGMGVNPGDDYSVQGTADYVLHIFEAGEALDLPALAVYAGLGGRINGPDDGHAELGIRFPVGLTYFWDQQGIEGFAEVVPVFDLAPDQEIDLNAVVGLRFYGW